MVNDFNNPFQLIILSLNLFFQILQWSTASTRTTCNGTLNSIRYSSQRQPNNNESKSLLQGQKSLSPSETSKFEEKNAKPNEEV